MFKNELVLVGTEELSRPIGLVDVGAIADAFAANYVFGDFRRRKAANTLRSHQAALTMFARFLVLKLRLRLPDDLQLYLTESEIAAEVEPYTLWARKFMHDADAWHGMTWGTVQAFVDWQLKAGHAIGTINHRLSTIKRYVGLSFKAGAMDAETYQKIKVVTGFAGKEAKRVDDAREVKRVGNKKAASITLTVDQAKALKTQPDTPQGRRDALLLCLLLDHGLRVGEAVRLEVSNFELKAGMMNFYRPKVDMWTTHKLTADTLRAVRAWMDSGDCPALGPVLRGSRKGGALTEAGVTERSASERVRELGARLGVEGLSAHDCRHFWATYWAGRVDLFRLQEAGGWKSLAMPRRYVEWAKIANEGMA
jgi:integrase